MNLYKYLYFLFISSLLTVILMTCVDIEQDETITYTIPDQPELPTGYHPKPGWPATSFAVATANPLATDAGYQILKAGGSAVDAAIAAQLVLSLTEPQSSGIGGGAFLLNWDGEKIDAYNGREIAPSGANETLFLDSGGDPISFHDAVRSGLSVGVPGTIALLKTVHDDHGLLEWPLLFEPAITLAEQGFQVSPRLHSLLDSDSALRDDPVASEYFYHANGDPVEIGERLFNPAYAQILRNISQYGISEFYEGIVAQDIVNRLESHQRPGVMVLDDLSQYPELDLNTEPMCNDWREYRICGFPPPSSGHITLMQILGILDQTNRPDVEFNEELPTADWLHLYFEASRLAFADRNQYIADPNYVDAPGLDWHTMLRKEYLAERAALISDTSMGIASHGYPGEIESQLGQQTVQPESGTSHISIIDPYGNVVSMTTTIESGFGSRIMSDGGTGLRGGFLLNNELTDFSLSPVDPDGHLIANRVEPGKRPRSSMTPSLVFDKESGKLLATLGSPGGAAIIHYTAKTIMGMYGWDLNAQEAIDIPNFVNYNGPSILEEGRFPDHVIMALQRRGHVVVERSLTSGIQAIQVTEEGLFGGADPRREGNVMGD